MGATTYNFPEIEAYQGDIMASHDAVEQHAADMLNEAHILADHTEGGAADSYAETAQLSDQVSQKAREVIQVINQVVAQAAESTLDNDNAGAGMLAM